MRDIALDPAGRFIAPGKHPAVGTTGCLLPLGFGRQAVRAAGLFLEPVAVHHRGVVRHAQRRVPLPRVPVGRVHERVRGPGDRVRAELLGRDLVGFQVVLVVPEGVELVPGAFDLRHPEAADLHPVSGAFDGVAPGFLVCTPHGELAAGHPNHFEGRGHVLLVSLRRVRVRVVDDRLEPLRLLNEILLRFEFGRLRSLVRLGGGLLGRLLTRSRGESQEGQSRAEGGGAGVSEWHIR